MEKQEQTKPVRGQNLLEWYEALISAALVLVLIFSFFFRIIQVDGSSMVPTLVNGDKLIVWGAGYEPQRGDVVIVDSYTSYGKPLSSVSSPKAAIRSPSIMRPAPWR